MSKAVDAAKPLDIICLGRVAVDFYAQQIGARLEDASTFAKYLGGSSGNVAYGTAVQGLKSSMLARVGDEHMGRFLREELQRVGCDTSHLITDKERLTALVILGIKDQDAFPLIFYRNNCADMAISADDFDEHYIASAKVLAITGTHLSHIRTREAVLIALDYARRNNVRTVLDIDYRPVLWGLTDLGDGETRFIDDAEVSRKLQVVLPYFDVIVGTEEEFHIAGGHTNTLMALGEVRKHTQATLVCKRGAVGCSVFEAAIPSEIDGGLNVCGVRVEVLNVLGAGDAFMSGLMRGYIAGESWHQACRYANACGALVVSRHGCAPAMPSRKELDDYLSRAAQVPRPDRDVMLKHLHRVTVRKAPERQNLGIVAVDHCWQLTDMARAAGADSARVAVLQGLLFRALEQTLKAPDLAAHHVGILAGATVSQQLLNTVTSKDWWLGRCIEALGARSLAFEYGDLGSRLLSWPQQQVVSCLVSYHPHDSDAMRAMQAKKINEVYETCCRSGHELLFMLSSPAAAKPQAHYYIDIMRGIYARGVRPDYWGLPAFPDRMWGDIEHLIQTNDPYCRGIVMLALDVSADSFAVHCQQAANASMVKGFVVGGAIFAAAAKAWLAGDINDKQIIAALAQQYGALIADWQYRK